MGDVERLFEDTPLALQSWAAAVFIYFTEEREKDVFKTSDNARSIKMLSSLHKYTLELSPEG